MFEPVAYAQSAAPRDLFVFDDQLKYVPSGTTVIVKGALGLKLPRYCNRRAGCRHYGTSAREDEADKTKTFLRFPDLEQSRNSVVNSAAAEFPRVLRSRH